jgi:hypothetical protein
MIRPVMAPRVLFTLQYCGLHNSKRFGKIRISVLIEQAKVCGLGRLTYEMLNRSEAMVTTTYNGMNIDEIT